MEVLLVEDERIAQSACQLILNGNGHQVSIVSSGKDALEKTENMSYDLILMDLSLPDMDGIETTKKIRQESLNKNTPIVALTMQLANKIHQQCYEVGMKTVIIKPITSIILLNLTRAIEQNCWEGQ